MSFSEEPSTRPDPDESLPEDMLEHGLRAALNADDDFLEPPSGVLDALERLGGRPSRVFLGEPGREDPGPVIAPAAPADQRLSRGKGQYRVDGELARGGMGVVLKGHDTDLGRDVALKVMHPEFSSRPESVQRFVEEAQIGGQLQHPGIVPVYELGLMADERPYFAMKLIKGRTLGSLFADRETPGADQRRFLGIFEQVCQTVAYAHARGVIHRDLKPSNIMVGSFGEVQVVDWGLAKVLQRAPRRRGADEKQQSAEVSVIETVRSEHGSSHSRAGSVMGTPAYMAPEQARGEVQEVTERADVFALGAILCEVLTGAPPYVGDRDAVMMQAAGAELQSAKQRLADCDGEEELVALALRCLAPAPSARPRNAEALAKAVQEHLSSVEERAKEARLEAERARARATAERKARKLTAALAGTVLVAVLGGGSGYLFVEGQRQARRERVAGLVNEALSEAATLRVQDSPEAALAAAQRAEALAQPDDVEAGLRERVTERIASLEEQVQRSKEQRARDERNAAFLARLDRVRTLERHESIPASADGHADLEPVIESFESLWQRRDHAYTAVFDDFDLPVGNAAVEGLAQALLETGVGAEIALRLDDWARVVRKLDGKDSTRGLRLLDIAHQADPDPLRERMRAAIATSDVDELRRLAEEMPVQSAGPTTWTVLAGGLNDLDAQGQAIELLKRAQRAYPDDPLVNAYLGFLYTRLDPPRHELAARYRQAAVAAKPDSHDAWHALGYSLDKLGEFQSSVAALERAIALDPEDALSHLRLAFSLFRAGQVEEAIAANRTAVRLAPGDARYHYELGEILVHAKRPEEAIPSLERAVELEPSAYHHFRLGVALRISDRMEEALPQAQAAVEGNPSNAAALRELALIYENLDRTEDALALSRRAFVLDDEDAHIRLIFGRCLVERGDYEEAIEILSPLREVELDDVCAPISACKLGQAYDRLGRHEESEAVFRELTRIHPDYGSGWHAYGVLRLNQARPGDAVEYLERAVELMPDDAGVIHNLGLALLRAGRAEESVKWFERTVELSPDAPEGFLSLGVGLFAAGRYAESRDVLEEALFLDPETSEAHVELARTLLVLGDLEGTVAEAELALELLWKVTNEADAAIFRTNAFLLKGQAHLNLEDPENALLALRELTRMEPSWAPGYGLLGHALEDLGDLEGALAAWREAARLDPTNEEVQRHLLYGGSGIVELRGIVEANPNDVTALNNLAWELALDPEAENYDPEEATELALRAVELVPEDPYVWNTLGLALVRSQRWDEAIEALEKSIALSSGRGDAEDWYFLAMAWHEKGDAARAGECYERARSFEQGNADELEGWDREVRALLGIEGD